MGRGRKRKNDPTIPKHIDQTKLPRGIYWDKSGSGRWYVREPHPEGSGHLTPTVAQASARLSELHSIMEKRSGKAVHGTIGYIMEKFRESTEYLELAQSTQSDYNFCEKEIRKIRTKLGVTFDKLIADQQSTSVFQRLNEMIAKGRPETRPGAGDGIRALPTKANKIQRYVRRLFAWGKRHGHCKTNPADGVKLATERKQFRMPEHHVYAAALQFARECGARPVHTTGSCAPYLWCVMEIAYQCRMRGIEVILLTDAHETKDGLRVSRVKGSRDNIVRWTPRLRTAWDAVIAMRAEAMARPQNRSRPVPIRPEDRFVFVNRSGDRLTKSALDQAWQHFMPAAIKAGVLTAEERFTLHGLKHRGITDSKGNRSDKQQASGHKSGQMLDVYDHELPVVEPAAAPEFSGEFSGVLKK